MKTRPISKAVLTLVEILSIISIALTVLCSIPLFCFSPMIAILVIIAGITIPIALLLGVQMIRDFAYHIELQTSILEKMLENNRK